MNIWKLWRPRITTTGQVTAVRTYRGMIYVRFTTPMRIEVATFIDYSGRELKRLQAALKSSETVRVKY